jgi:hypothetical protein
LLKKIEQEIEDERNQFDIHVIKETHEAESEEDRKRDDPIRMMILNKSKNLKNDPEVVRNNLTNGRI